MEQDPYGSYLGESDHEPVNETHEEPEHEGVTMNFVDARPKATPYKCQQCDTLFESRNKVFKHLKQAHWNPDTKEANNASPAAKQQQVFNVSEPATANEDVSELRVITSNSDKVYGTGLSFKNY